MKVLITGACGHIRSYLLENIYKIKKIKKTVLVDNLESNRFHSLFNNSKKNNLSFFKRDLNDKNALKDFSNIDVIVHLAAMNRHENQQIIFDKNIDLVQKLQNMLHGYSMKIMWIIH